MLCGAKNLILARLYTQWNSVNTVTNGSKNIGRINGVVILSGQDQISWLEGSNDKFTIHRIRISWTGR